MSIVVIADGVIGVEGKLMAGSADELFSVHGVERDLAEDSVVEEACRLKEKFEGATLTLLTTAPAAFEKDMRTYIAAGCERSIRIECSNEAMFDVRKRAKLVADRLKEIEGWQVAMFLDRTAGGAPALLPHYVSELLAVPSISSVVAAEQTPEGLLVTTRRSGMIGRYCCRSQTILAVSSRVELRKLGFKDVHRSRKAQIETFNASDLEFSFSADAGAVVKPASVRAPVLDQQEGGAVVEEISIDAAAERLASLLEPYLSR